MASHRQLQGDGKRSLFNIQVSWPGWHAWHHTKWLILLYLSNLDDLCSLYLSLSQSFLLCFHKITHSWLGFTTILACGLDLHHLPSKHHQQLVINVQRHCILSQDNLSDDSWLIASTHALMFYCYRWVVHSTNKLLPTLHFQDMTCHLNATWDSPQDRSGSMLPSILVQDVEHHWPWQAMVN